MRTHLSAEHTALATAYFKTLPNTPNFLQGGWLLLAALGFARELGEQVGTLALGHGVVEIVDLLGLRLRRRPRTWLPVVDRFLDFVVGWTRIPGELRPKVRLQVDDDLLAGLAAHDRE